MARAVRLRLTSAPRSSLLHLIVRALAHVTYG